MSDRKKPQRKRLSGAKRKRWLAENQAMADRLRAAGYEVVKVTPTRIVLGALVLSETTATRLSTGNSQ